MVGIADDPAGPSLRLGTTPTSGALRVGVAEAPEGLGICWDEGLDPYFQYYRCCR